MRILSVHIDGFGKFVDRDIVFGKAANVIRGQNEAGKSTLHAFIEAMLLGPNKKPRGFSRSLYEAMEPWDESVPYQGSMRIEYQGKTYQILRCFEKGNESLQVFCEDTGEEEKDPASFLKTVMEDLTPEACRNSVSIGQLSAKTGAALQRELSGYVENVGSTASPDLSARRAVEYLEKKKEELRSRIRDDAAREYAASLSRIRNIETELDRPENENRIRYFEDRVDETRTAAGVQKEQIAETEEKIREATRVLADNHIRTAQDVEEMEKKGKDLYDAFRTALEMKRSGLRIAGMVISALLLAVVVGVLIFCTDLPADRSYFIAGAAVAFIVFILLAIAQFHAEKEFQKAQKALQDYMEPRIGRAEIGEESMQALLRNIHSYDGLLAERERDQQKKTDMEKGLNALLETEESLSGELKEQNGIQVRVEEKLLEENSLRDEAARLRLCIAENNRLKEQIDAIDIAIDTIGDLSTTIKGRLGTYLNNEASRALRDLTDGHYRSMDIGSGSDMSLNSRDGMISVNDVSAGTMDQIYLAVRLAAARFMMKEKDSLPLIFDDSFALYDDDRLKSAVRFVAKDYGGQIFIFTCHHREENALEEKADCRLVEL